MQDSLLIPVATLSLYRVHFEGGCHSETKCIYKDDKVYHEWVTLKQTDICESPKKVSKGGKTNKKDARKKLKLEGKSLYILR